MVVVHDFAVTPGEVMLDSSVMHAVLSDAGVKPQSAEETRVGEMVSDRLSQRIVEELQKQGIKAVRAGPAVVPSATTADLKGEFLRVDQGDQAQRVWIGFGLGASELRTRIQIFQDGKLQGQGNTSTVPSLKPGMLPSIGASVATGGTVPLVIGGVTNFYSEAFVAGVEADASRTAKEVVRVIREGYVKRGWLPPL
jgi:hypothetical protein